jgi:hypothetical protein
MKNLKRASFATQNYRNSAQESAYWQLTFLIFSAFFLDHTQNEYLAFYFSNKINKDVISLKYTLEIVQQLLDNSQITKQETDYEAIEL